MALRALMQFFLNAENQCFCITTQVTPKTSFAIAKYLLPSQHFGPYILQYTHGYIIFQNRILCMKSLYPHQSGGDIHVNKNKDSTQRYHMPLFTIQDDYSIDSELMLFGNMYDFTRQQ